MYKSTRIAEVWYDQFQIGRLVLAPNGIAVFEYKSEWIENGFSISPFYLPLRSGAFNARAIPFDGLFGVFSDSLPDGWGNLLIDRWLRSKDINPSSLTVLDRLCLVGSKGMGALTYRPDRMSEKSKTEYPLDFYALEVEKIIKDDFSGALDILVQNAGTSGGARPKVLLNIDNKDWLIKFKTSADPSNIGEIEYQYSLLAGRCGIEMPETRLFEGKYFGSQRFDLKNDKRVHVHSAAGLLYANYRLPSLDYLELMKATLALTRDIDEVAKMFRLMVFNVIIGNKDDHAKNFSFLYLDGAWKVSPGYDLLPSDGFNGHHSTTINGNGKPTLADCLEVAKKTSFPMKQAKIIVEELREKIKL